MKPVRKFKPREQWRCPQCGRKLLRKGQPHPCVRVGIEDHFKDRPPLLREIYETLIEIAGGFGPVRVEAAKASINLMNGLRFALIYVRGDSLLLEILSPKPDDGAKAGINRGHFLKLSSKSDLDEKLVEMLREAYSRSAA